MQANVQTKSINITILTININFAPDDVGEPEVSNEMEELRKRLSLDSKMRAMMKQVLGYMVFLILLIILSRSNQDPNVFYQNNDLYKTFGDKVIEVR